LISEPTARAIASPTPPSPADVRAELERIATGPVLAQSDRLVSFLRFIVNETLAGRADQIKESTVGVEVFGRPPAYDPKSDPIVRVQARQLRQKLRDHYDLAGHDAPVIIELPKGGYVPQFRHPQVAARSPVVTALPRPRRPARFRYAMVVAAVTLMLGAMSSELYRRVTNGVSATALPRTIAVLPFENLTGDPTQEYVSDGLAESLIAELSQLKDVKVISRGSAFTFKGKDADPREVGRALGVSAIFEGSVRRNGEMLRVDVRLVSTSNGEVLWSGDTFEQVPDDLFAIEDEVTCHVTAALAGIRCGQKAASAVDRGTTDLEAYRSYLQGRFHIHSQYGEAGPERALQTAVDHFTRAIDRDPRFASAYAGLADAYTQLVWFSRSDVRPLLTRAKSAALKAIELNGRLAEAHTSLSAVYLHEWDFAAAGSAIERAVSLAPSSAWARHEHATYLVAIGQTEAGVAEMRKAEELDPLNTTIIADRGNTLVAAHRYEDALAQYRRACELQLTCAPDPIVGATYLLMGKYTQAIAELQQARKDGAVAVDSSVWLAIAYARAGMTREAERQLAEVTLLAKGKHIPYMFFAYVYASLGQPDRAFDMLDRAYRDREIGLAHIRATVWLESLQRDPRFVEMVRRVGLPN
jgi:TolB-like protein/Tfp pilus assembly protein PilF